MRTRPAAGHKGIGGSSITSVSAVNACAGTKGGTNGGTNGSSSCPSASASEEVEVVHAVDFKSTVMGDRLAADAGESAQDPSMVETAVV